MDRYNDRTSTATADDISDLARELERIKQDLRQLRGDIAGLGADAARAARASINEAARHAGERGRAAAEFTESRIAEHPFISVASAFAVGMLLGMKFGGFGSTPGRKE